MRPVFWPAMLAGFALIAHGQASPAPAPQQPAGGPPAVLSPKALAVTPTSAAIETDPAKLAAPSPNGAKPQTAATSGETFVIGAEDVLSVQVWGDSRIAPNPLTVRPDGMISLSLLGEIKAAGKTAEQLGNEISERLKSLEILKENRVNVNVVAINSRKIFIQGEVNKPGAYPLIVPMNVLEALVNAGGFRDFANKKKIVVQRGAKRFNFNYNEVIAGKKLEQNIYLEPGDLIIVK